MKTRSIAGRTRRCSSAARAACSRLRVFPIPPNGRKEIVVNYAQELVGGAPYAIPLRGLPELGVLDVSVGAKG